MAPLWVSTPHNLEKLLARLLSMAVAFVFNDEIPSVATLAFYLLDLLNYWTYSFPSFDRMRFLGFWALRKSRVTSPVDGLVRGTCDHGISPQ